MRPSCSMEFGQAAIHVVPFTSSFADFDKGVNRLIRETGCGLGAAGSPCRGEQDLAKRPATRRAIVTLNLEPSDEQSREEPKKIVEAFRKSGAQLWSVSVQRGGLKNSKRDVVINDFAKATGGQRDFIVGISAVDRHPPALRGRAGRSVRGRLQAPRVEQATAGDPGRDAAAEREDACQRVCAAVGLSRAYGSGLMLALRAYATQGLWLSDRSAL